MKERIILGLCLLTFINGVSQDLTYYIQQAELNNPQIQAFDLQYSMATEKVNEVRSLPNLEFKAGYFLSETETRTGPQQFVLSVKQMLPWFGTIDAREKFVSAQADAQFIDYLIAKRKLALSVSQSYYSLYAIKSKQGVLQEHVRLLQTYEKLALTAVEVGNASAVDVLRLQIRQNEIMQVNQVLEEKYQAEKVLFNNLLNRDQALIIEVANELIIPLTDPVYNDTILSFNPELIKFDKLYESVSQSEILNQKEAAPSIGFGLDYIAVSERPNLDFIDNGKDILLPMVTLSIPVFSKKYNSRSIQNEFKHKEIAAQKENRINILESFLAGAISSRNASRLQYNMHIKNLDRAKNAEEILIKNYETGTIDFNDVLEVQELQLKFETKKIESVQEYYVHSAIINYLIIKDDYNNF